MFREKRIPRWPPSTLLLKSPSSRSSRSVSIIIRCWTRAIWICLWISSGFMQRAWERFVGIRSAVIRLSRVQRRDRFLECFAGSDHKGEEKEEKKYFKGHPRVNRFFFFSFVRDIFHILLLVWLSFVQSYRSPNGFSRSWEKKKKVYFSWILQQTEERLTHRQITRAGLNCVQVWDQKVNSVRTQPQDIVRWDVYRRFKNRSSPTQTPRGPTAVLNKLMDAVKALRETIFHGFYH